MMIAGDAEIKKTIFRAFLIYTFLLPIVIITLDFFGKCYESMTLSKAYVIISISFWVFIKNFYNLSRRCNLIMLFVFPFMIASFFICEEIGRLFSIIILFFLGRFESILLLLPFTEVNILLALYFIGTDIIYSQKMINNPKVIFITVLGVFLYFLNDKITVGIILAIIFSMMYKTLVRFREYHRHSLLLILFQFLLLSFCYVKNLINCWIIFSLSILMPNVVLLEDLIRRGWITAKRVMRYEIISLMYSSLMIEIIYMLTTFEILLYTPIIFLAIIFISQL